MSNQKEEPRDPLEIAADLKPMAGEILKMAGMALRADAAVLLYRPRGVLAMGAAFYAENDRLADHLNDTVLPTIEVLMGCNRSGALLCDANNHVVVATAEIASRLYSVVDRLSDEELGQLSLQLTALAQSHADKLIQTITTYVEAAEARTAAPVDVDAPTDAEDHG